ncbi:tRNA (uridine(34)/cytosine(34)/5-carboxymethylaminomethyluridine(34)-2'-O)-methyltransferase TrmL [Herbivorax sp. ANBcel31]|uniref:tRNA (uridine(34)/cytosine(34)/5- carboxymethylaminomethyluridine(34)-2'-O)- methyltransferase TrmL n=1 Tax=Herbivorax sp. ANBcel31 TaxID=3069754 RepID=UPI0027B61308|nr:tRNA (uridine(34)/cytosine(34)/5-carboxymethylaminomethyluridine(34)-2'-O)-methyltransferase TrmL [Herbivorax sp. ANBcel31]MDQ2086128.1 tRNA (uridine(34)/cytosine(34)/5-carboxymethylaminomethyluridine(34)-2'-O)-methyltransferase TrmL [Herbivorax sp. ANBcel31]
MNIVLVEPEIPQNTGNIARTCAATGAKLHMVKPLGFSVDDKYLRRAGMDYWNQVNVKYYNSFEELNDKYSDGVFFFATTKAVNSYVDVDYPENSFIVFGKETAGLPEKLLFENKSSCIRIPMKEDSRSLNLSNSAAIILYEALRQNNFKSLSSKGKLTQYTW